MGRLALLLLLALPATAEDLTRLLQSDEAKDRAWGCWRAGEQVAEAAVPALRRRINDENRTVRRLALDALIRIGAPVPWQDLQPVWDTERAFALVLLARDPDAEVLLDLLDTDLDTHSKTVLCNLLSGMRAPGFAARMMRELKVHLEVRVVDQGIEGVIGLGGGAGGRFFRGRQVVRVAEGWPPAVHIEIIDGVTAEAVPFAPGPFPVSYVRHTWETRGSLPRRRDPPDWTRRPFAYLAEALQMDDLPLASRYSETVPWNGTDAVVAAVKAARARVVADHAALVALLVEHDLLDRAEANALDPGIRLSVSDFREEPGPPLPDFDNAGK